MNTARVLAAISVLVVTGLSLGACRQEEMGRPLFYEKGTYGGKADEKIDAETIKQARQRGWMQQAF